MFNIKLKDNDYQGFKLADVSDFDFAKLGEPEQSKIREALDSINNVSLKELENKGVIVFPTSAVEKELDDRKILSVQDLMKDDPIIKTTNIMGFFSIGDVQIQIRSRFDKDEKQFFLHYMLSKVCNVAPTITQTDANHDPLYEFCVYLFPTFLKKAVNQGLFRTYITREYNDSNIRGVIDFPRHFRNNIPFNGKIAYRTREYSHDNFTMQLVRHTIEFIYENNSLRKILSIDEDMRNAVQNIRGCTESYSKSARTFVINKNLKPITHPYYTEYEPLRRLCLMILTHKRISYGQTKEHQINGIIFDGASLWEEYLWKLLKPYDFRHPQNRERSGGIRMFDNSNKDKASEDPELTFDNFDKNHRKIYPDFYKPNKDDDSQDGFILDAKYKHLQNGVGREDLFQVVTYMHTMNIKNGGFIYPADSLTDSNSKLWTLAGLGGTIHVCGMKIPTNKEKFDDFCKDMEAQEKQLLEAIQERISP